MSKEEVLDTLYLLQNTMAMFKEPLSIDQVIRLVGDIAKCVAKIPDTDEEKTVVGCAGDTIKIWGQACGFTNEVFGEWRRCNCSPDLLPDPLPGMSVSDNVFIITFNGTGMCGFFDYVEHRWKTDKCTYFKSDNPCTYWLHLYNKPIGI